MNQIFDADDVVLAQLLLDDVVGGDGGTAGIKLAKSAHIGVSKKIAILGV